MSYDQQTITELADRLVTAQRTKVGAAPLRDMLSSGDATADLDAAYAVQRLNIDRRVAAGERIVGRKIGLTSVAVQTQLGVDSPDFGALFAGDTYCDSEPVKLGQFLLPRVEAEVAFVLSADLDMPSPTAVDVLRATDFVLPAIEIVDSRVADWGIKLVDTVADNASGAATVLGLTPVPLLAGEPFDLRTCGMVIDRGGEQVSVGAGAACLGSPVTAVVWLARELVRRGDPLRAGDLVMSGALGPVVPVTGPGVFEARIDGLGSVRAVFEEGDK